MMYVPTDRTRAIAIMACIMYGIEGESVIKAIQHAQAIMVEVEKTEEYQARPKEGTPA